MAQNMQNHAKMLITKRAIKHQHDSYKCNKYNVKCEFIYFKIACCWI